MEKYESKNHPETDTYFMCKAIEVARKGLKSGEVPVGCVIVKAKEIVA
jgi:tRNA(Arg) A34 adenosine deaminase TadA